MKLGLINSAWAQAGRETSYGIRMTKEIGFDTIDIFARLVTKGRSSPNRVTAHTDLLEDFPYLGTPHGVASRAEKAASSAAP